jgi:hypothetical protein
MCVRIALMALVPAGCAVGANVNTDGSVGIPTARMATLTAAARTPAPIAMRHVLTADYYGQYGSTLAPSLVGPWLTWAETNIANNPGLRQVGVKVMIYTNPNRMAPGDPMYPSQESAFAHTCSGARIGPLTYGEYLMNPGASSLRQIWRDYITAESSSVTWDAIFEDDANDVAGVSTLPCDYSASSWLAASQGENSYQAPYPIVYNGLQISNEMGLNVSANVLGGMREGCYGDSNANPKIWYPYWSWIENREIAMAQQGKLFFCYDHDTTDAASALDGRLYTYASFLLTYTPSLSILWEIYKTPSGFHVQPESQLVALDPLVPQPSDISGLEVGNLVYGREYAHCYVAGVYVGPCAAVVNADLHNAHPYPYGTKYGHTLVLSGGGILDGGTVSTQGPAPPRVLPRLGAAIVFR